MKGRIYPNRGGYVVRFGRQISKWFKEKEAAERFLNGVRYETDKGTFDPRDYDSDRPLAIRNLVKQYMKTKKQTVKPSSYRNYRNYLNKACASWGDRNIKSIAFAEIEDFLWSQNVSDKTRSDMKSALHAFWTWLLRRDVIDRMPRFPVIKYELGWRNIIDLETQQAIIDEVERISGHISPKIALGIRWLATYISIRPAEMLNLKEGQIDHKIGCFIIPSPKEKRPKVVPLIDEDIEILKEIPRGLPELYFFRHDKTANGAKAGQPFGKRMFYKWWKRACENLGIEGVDLYGGTKHSTCTALGKIMSPEQIKNGTMHSTNAAFERYFQGQGNNAKMAYREARNLQQTYNTKGTPKGANVLKLQEINGGSDETRTRDLRRDRPAF